MNRFPTLQELIQWTQRTKSDNISLITNKSTGYDIITLYVELLNNTNKGAWFKFNYSEIASNELDTWTDDYSTVKFADGHVLNLNEYSTFGDLLSEHDWIVPSLSTIETYFKHITESTEHEYSLASLSMSDEFGFNSIQFQGEYTLTANIERINEQVTHLHSKIQQQADELAQKISTIYHENNFILNELDEEQLNEVVNDLRTMR